jgi:hypothetical protein
MMINYNLKNIARALEVKVGLLDLDGRIWGLNIL